MNPNSPRILILTKTHKQCTVKPIQTNKTLHSPSTQKPAQARINFHLPLG
jgi:hypothetical protein